LRASRSSASKGQPETQPRSVLQFRVALKEIAPEIWRRVQVPAAYTFWDLHVAIQDAMGWMDCHLHVFRFAKPRSRKATEIGIPDPDGLPGERCLPGWEVPLQKFFSTPGDSCDYEYDFGDGWEHSLVLEAIQLPEGDSAYPRCIAGERSCPPEDVGGPHGYQDFLEALLDPRHPEHREMVTWSGGDFDTERFDPRAIKFDDPRKRLRRMLRG